MNIPNDLREEFQIPKDAELVIEEYEMYRKCVRITTRNIAYPRLLDIFAQAFIAPISISDYSAAVIALAERAPDLSLRIAEMVLKEHGVHIAMYFVTREQDDVYEALKDLGYSPAIQFKNLNHGSEGMQIRVMLKPLVPVDTKSLFKIKPVWEKDTYDAWWDSSPDPDCIEYYDGDLAKAEFEGEHVTVMNTVGCCGSFTVLEHNAPKHFERLLEASLNNVGEAPFGTFLVRTDEEAAFLEQHGAVPIAYYEMEDGPRVIYGMLRKELSVDYDYWDKHQERLNRAQVVV